MTLSKCIITYNVKCDNLRIKCTTGKAVDAQQVELYKIKGIYLGNQKKRKIFC